ncbi:DUF2304 domain-containing protein [Cellulomonas hominis]|uniref:DUF2304 domain-containing protein n=1 Tax=Cellulomonas hominis TaxID=156981 RepID=UPI001443A75C|nr:DUF2304 domain-containing protein [Cellulomonas hominis]NKY09934.1 DUF2304 domain-containing protein [Cellulomonas hominis]
MSGYVLALVLGLLTVVVLVQLLRSRRIREKYAAIWLVLALGICILAAFPDLAFWLATLVGVQTPVNLLFAVAAVVLLAVCLQLSGEVSSLEEKTRTLAEEVALLRQETRPPHDAGLRDDDE